MIALECPSVRRDLAAFVDGELRGDRVLRVLRHLDRCASCTGEVESLRGLGDLLRTNAPADPDGGTFDGLAGTVISRTRAEANQSWWAVARRASEDWHW